MTSHMLRTTTVTAARGYQDLPAWQKSLALAEKIYAATDGFPIREHTGLGAEMRRKAFDIPSNIAAAVGRNNEYGMNDSYSKSQSATAELTTALALACRLDFIDAVAASSLFTDIEEVSRLITALKHGLKVAAKDEKRLAEDQAKHEEDVKQRERRPFKKREDRDARGERSERPYRARSEGGDKPYRARKPDGDRPYRDRKPTGDKPYRARSEGGDKPYRDRKPAGDRPYRERSDKPFRKPRD